jgi:putative SOS response-associated peptidase YedK
MCGRFYIENDIEDIIASYGIREVKNLIPVKGEIYPGTNIPVVLKDKNRTLDFFRWGFKISSLNREVINARIETVSEKPTFRRAFYKNRCIVPANAFFEWETKEKTKIKYKISAKDIPIFSIAGIYDQFLDSNNKPYYGVVLLTKQANEDMSKLHHRMPVFITKDIEGKWLGEESMDVLELAEALEVKDSVKLKISPAQGVSQLTLF